MVDSYLHRYCLNNNKLYMEKWHHYFDIYERHFSRFRNKSPVMLEIGVMGGGSLSMWRDYFGDGCKVIGLDINPTCAQYNDPSNNIEVFIGSQDDPKILNSILSKYPNIDIVLDDGSHFSKHMLTSFETLYDHVNQNGIYMLEDVCCCYWPSHDGGLKKQDSFIEYAKDKIDEINTMGNHSELSLFAATTDSITFYDSVIIFERRRQSQRKAILTSPMANIISKQEIK